MNLWDALGPQSAPMVAISRPEPGPIIVQQQGESEQGALARARAAVAATPTWMKLALAGAYWLLTRRSRS